MLFFLQVVLCIGIDVVDGLSTYQLRIAANGNTIADGKEQTTTAKTKDAHRGFTIGPPGPATRDMPKRRMCPMDPLTGWCRLEKHRDMRCESMKRKSKARGKDGIPNQLILTGSEESFADIAPQLRVGIEKVLQRNPQMKLRYLGDGACSSYVKEHFRFLSVAYDNEPRGAFRGDICRAVVLFYEGGYYLDLDFDLRVPLRELVDNETSFVSAFSMTNARARQRMYGGSMLNALMIATPKSKIMASTLYHIISWYRGDPSVPWGRTDSIYVGTVTLWRGLANLMACECPRANNLDKLWFQMQKEKSDVPLQWSCGQESIRLYVEKKLLCNTTSIECPEERVNNTFDGARYGLFTPGPARHLIGWPRQAWCTSYGCNTGGHSTKTNKIPRLSNLGI